MSSQIISYAQGISVLYSILEKSGMDPDAIEKQTGVAQDILQVPDVSLPLEQFIRLWKTAIDATGDPALAIHLSETYEKETMHFVATIALNCKNLLEAAKAWGKYARLVCDADTVTIEETEESLIIAYSNSSPEHQNIWIPEHYLSLLIQHARTFTQKNIVPLEVCFQHSDPGYSKEYKQFFKTSVLFEQEQNAVYLDKSDCYQAIQYRDPYLQKLLKDYANQHLKQVSAQDSLEKLMASYIIETLPKGVVNIETTARALNMSRSTLQRKLNQSGTSFKTIVEEIRQKLARVYLEHQFKISQIAYLLGYSEPSTFHHAFKRWFGISPGEFAKGKKLT